MRCFYYRQLKQKKEFLSTHIYQSATELTSGTVAFEDYKKLGLKEETATLCTETDDAKQSSNKYVC